MSSGDGLGQFLNLLVHGNALSLAIGTNNLACQQGNIRGNWRHHLRPYVGLGYSEMHESSNWDYESDDFHKLGYVEWDDRGFELGVGIAYDFNITHHWVIGAFIEESILTREQDVMGLRVRYSF